MQNDKQLTSLRMGACELVRRASAPTPGADHFDSSKFSLWGGGFALLCLSQDLGQNLGEKASNSHSPRST